MVVQRRETLGEILRSKKFFVYVGLCIAFDFTVITYSLQDLWSEFYEIQAWGTNGLVVGNCLGVFASNITLISWVLVDENSWLGKALILLITSVPLTICGAYFTVQYFNYGKDFYKEHHHYFIQHETSYYALSNDSGSNGQANYNQFSVWMPILAGINFLQGIVGLIFFVFVCMSLDGVDINLS